VRYEQRRDDDMVRMSSVKIGMEFSMMTVLRRKIRGCR